MVRTQAVQPGVPCRRSSEFRPVLRLAFPLVVVQVGIMAMGVADTVMVGRISATALAAVALGNIYFFAVSVFGTGVLMALDPLVAQAVGARDEPAIARGVQRGFLIAMALAVVASVLLLPGEWVLAWLRQPPEVAALAAEYVRAVIPGMFPYYAFVVLRQSLQAMGRTTPIVLSIVAANILNVLLNWVLIFGKLGLPALGVVGSGWATSGSRWFMAIMLLAISWRELRPYLLPVRAEAFQPRPLLRMIRLGAPIGVQNQLEYGAFSAVGILMGWIGTDAMAGHQVAINLASLTFMVPLGISAAAAVLVGQAVGRGDMEAARRSARASLVCGAAFMSCTAILLLSIPETLARLYSTQPEVILVAGLLIPLAGVFQVFDGLQVVAIGVLRGTGDTRTPMLVNVLGFWLIGIPIGAYLGFRLGAGPQGLWWGMVIGLAAVATVLLLRVRARLGQEVPRVVIEDEPGGVSIV